LRAGVHDAGQLRRKRNYFFRQPSPIHRKLLLRADENKEETAKSLYLLVAGASFHEALGE
jgi:hypothetical protein